MSARLSCLLSGPFRRTVPPVWQTTQPDLGVRERPVCAGCHAAPGRAWIGLPRIGRGRNGRAGIASLRYGQRYAQGRRDCGQPEPSLNSNCQKTRRKQFRSVSGGGALSMRGCRQRLPRVRSSTHLGNGEVRAKTSGICACASTAARKPAWTGEIDVTVLLKSGASRQEKASYCSRNGAAGGRL